MNLSKLLRKKLGTTCSMQREELIVSKMPLRKQKLCSTKLIGQEDKQNRSCLTVMSSLLILLCRIRAFAVPRGLETKPCSMNLSKLLRKKLGTTCSMQREELIVSKMPLRKQKLCSTKLIGQ